LLQVAFLLVNAPNCHLSLVLASVVQGDAVNCSTTLAPCLNYSQAQFTGTREGFSATELFITKLRNRVNDENVL